MMENNCSFADSLPDAFWGLKPEKLVGKYRKDAKILVDNAKLLNGDYTKDSFSDVTLSLDGTHPEMDEKMEKILAVIINRMDVGHPFSQTLGIVVPWKSCQGWQKFIGGFFYADQAYEVFGDWH